MSVGEERGGAVVGLLQALDGLEDLFWMLSPPTAWRLVGQGLIAPRVDVRATYHPRT